jgi:transcriptional regulator with XRE-family HTH domain
LGDDRVTDGDRGGGGAAEAGARPLRAVRAERLLSLRELAQLADVATGTIYQIEAGRTMPQLSVIRRLSGALDVDSWEVAEFRRAMRARGGLR